MLLLTGMEVYLGRYLLESFQLEAFARERNETRFQQYNRHTAAIPFTYLACSASGNWQSELYSRSRGHVAGQLHDNTQS